jgi:very-short-patch-repair endonuclease
MGRNDYMSKKKTHKEFLEEVFALTGDEYSVLTDYTTCHQKVRFLHHICGFEYMCSPNKFTSQGRRCPRCAGKERFTLERVNEIIGILGKGEYTLLSKEYKNNHEDLKIKHTCGFVYMVPLNEFKAGNRCPRCARSRSRGEELIEDILTKYGIDFRRNVHIKGLYSKKGNRLEMDFYLPKFHVFIEFDGEQHFAPTRFSNKDAAKRKFELLQENDMLKNLFFKDRKRYRLLRYNYKQNAEFIERELLTELLK